MRHSVKEASFYQSLLFDMKTLTTLLAISSIIVLAGCSGSSTPLTKEEQAKQQGMTMEEYDESSAAAARMNMTMEEHMKMMEE